MATAIKKGDGRHLKNSQRPEREVMSNHLRSPVDIVHNEAASRFETRIDGWLCRCDYYLTDGVMQIVHTEVAPALEGQGIAAAMVQAALDHARRHGLRVRPRCSYVRAYMKRHPETQALLA
jgi:uncharacterized protein